jgi:hypothetical protein
MEVEMKRILILPLLGLSLGGCAVLSSSPAPSGATGSSAASASPYEAMESSPPEAQREDVPKLEEKQVWVPGYYQPVAGIWVWHQGQPMNEKSGYKILPASYREEGGKVYFTPPRWHRVDVAVK